MFMLNNILRWISYVLAVLALAAGMAVAYRRCEIMDSSGLSAAVISAAPLLLVGASFLIMQPILRPRWTELLKNALLAATFLLWGAIQLMPQNAMSMRLGNVVIALYVLDLAWVVLGHEDFDQREIETGILASARPALLGIVTQDPFGDAARFFGALRFDRDVKDRLNAIGQLSARSANERARESSRPREQAPGNERDSGHS